MYKFSGEKVLRKYILQGKYGKNFVYGLEFSY